MMKARGMCGHQSVLPRPSTVLSPLNQGDAAIGRGGLAESRPLPANHCKNEGHEDKRATWGVQAPRAVWCGREAEGARRAGGGGTHARGTRSRETGERPGGRETQKQGHPEAESGREMQTGPEIQRHMNVEGVGRRETRRGHRHAGGEGRGGGAAHGLVEKDRRERQGAEGGRRKQEGEWGGRGD